MDNVLETNGVPLVVFGGAVPELAPEDLPEGACPFNQDCDFNPGSVFSRAGRVNQVTYQNLVLDRIAASGKSIPGQFAPNEVAWVNPNAITLNSPPTYAAAALNQSLNFSNIVQYAQILQNTPTATNFVGSLPNPVTVGNYVAVFLFIDDTNGVGEGVILTTLKDQNNVSADVVGNQGGGPFFQFNAFYAYYKNMTDGGQTFTATIMKNGGGNITASPYAMAIVEVVGTANTGGADPTDFKFLAGNNLSISQGTGGTNVVTTQANELLIGAVQTNNATANPPFMAGSPFPAYKPPTVILAEKDLGSGEFQQQAIFGQLIPSNPAAPITFTNTGSITAVHFAVSCLTLKMTATGSLGMPGYLGVDQALISNGTTQAINFPTVTVTNPNEIGLFFACYAQNFGYPVGVNPLVNFGSSEIGGAGAIYQQLLPTGSPVSAVANQLGTSNWLAAVLTFQVVGGVTPGYVQRSFSASGGIPAPSTLTFAHALTPGNSIIFVSCSAGSPATRGWNITDTVNDVFTSLINTNQLNGLGGTMQLGVALAQNIIGGNTDVTINFPGGTGFGNAVVQAFELPAGMSVVLPTAHSQILKLLISVLTFLRRRQSSDSKSKYPAIKRISIPPQRSPFRSLRHRQARRFTQRSLLPQMRRSCSAINFRIRDLLRSRRQI